MTRLRRRAALAGVIALASTVALAGPASAHATLTVASPRPNQTLDTDTPTITVVVNAEERTTMQSVRLTVEQLEPTKRTISVADRPVESGRATFPDVQLLHNGKYRITARAGWTHSTLLGVSEHSGTASEGPFDWLVGEVPATPSGVKASVNAETRAVTVTWKANPEPDILFYQVQRDKGPGTDVAVLGKPTGTTFVDASTAEAGGEYRYRVVAVRRGATADEGLNSDPSPINAETTARVPDPPPPPTTAPPAGTATTVAGTTATTAAGGTTGTTIPAGSPGALATSGKVDLSGFNTIQNQARRSATPRTLPEVDTGFQGTLPFDIPEGEAAEEGPVEEGGELGEVAADSPQFRELGAEDDATDRQRSLAFLAAGLLATVLLMHVLWVKSEVEKVPLEPVAPEGPQPTGDGFRPAPFRPAGSRAKVPPMAKPPKARPTRLGGRAGSKGPKVPSGV